MGQNEQGSLPQEGGSTPKLLYILEGMLPPPALGYCPPNDGSI